MTKSLLLHNTLPLFNPPEEPFELSSSISMESKPELSLSLEDCLKLLRGERDEQRLAGLLLVTKFLKGDDLASLRKVYDAVGPQFLDRLLKTGIGMKSGPGSGGAGDNRDAYLQLSITVLAAFCCVPEIASLEEMV